MPIANDVPEVLETTEPERLATGFIFTEGPLWHPDGHWYFVDLRRNQLLRLTPGTEPELVRTTIGGNGTTFDLQGRLIVCEGDDRRITRMRPDGTVETLVDNYKGGRLNRPNDVICHSNGSLYFTDPDKRRPYHESEIPGPGGGRQSLGRRTRLSFYAGRRLERAGTLRIPERARAVARRAHDVCGEHAVLTIYPRDQARRGRQHGGAQRLRRPQRGHRAGYTRRLEGRQHRPGLLHRAGRHLSDCAGRPAHRRHQMAGASCQFRLWWAGSADAVLLRAHLGLYVAGQGTRQSAPLVQVARAVSSAGALST